MSAAKVRDRLAAIEEHHDIDGIDARDQERPVPVQMEPSAPRRWSRLVSELAHEVIELATHPLWSWGFPTLDREAPIPIGSLVYVVGATGRGKSSFLAQIARHHERHAGPALIISAELSGAIMGARLVCQAVEGSTWIGVVRGDVAAADVIAALRLPRMHIADDIGTDWPQKLDGELSAMRAEHPDAAPLVVVDYVQICKVDGRDASGSRTPARCSAIWRSDTAP